MNIAAIGPNFQGKRNNVDDFINYDDMTIRKMALQRTVKNVDSERSKKISNALYYSAPVAAGLSAALLKNDLSSTLFSKNLTGVAGRAAKGLRVAALWASTLAAIDLLGAGRRKLAENSKTVRDFDKKNPLLSNLITLAAGIGTVIFVGKGFGKLAGLKTPKLLQKGTEKVAKFLNNNKYIGKAKDGILKLSRKTPSALKEIGATALDWAPSMLILGGFFNSLRRVGKENNEFIKNYSMLKDRQTAMAQARVKELKMENEAILNEACDCDDC